MKSDKKMKKILSEFIEYLMNDGNFEIWWMEQAIIKFLNKKYDEI